MVWRSASCLLGGNDFDEALRAMLERKLREQGVEVPATEAFRAQLRRKAEELKQTFASEQGQSVSEEIALPDGEFFLEFAREDFEEACRAQRLFERFFEFVSDALRAFPAALQLDAVETVGGNMLIARLGRALLGAVQDRGLRVRALSATLDKLEACARGCALFAQKGLLERRIVCAAQDVLLGATGGAMPLCGCRSGTAPRGRFAIETEDAPRSAGEHDCRRGAAG